MFPLSLLTLPAPLHEAAAVTGERVVSCAVPQGARPDGAIAVDIGDETAFVVHERRGEVALQLEDRPVALLRWRGAMPALATACEVEELEWVDVSIEFDRPLEDLELTDDCGLQGIRTNATGTRWSASVPRHPSCFVLLETEAQEVHASVPEGVFLIVTEPDVEMRPDHREMFWGDLVRTLEASQELLDEPAADTSAVSLSAEYIVRAMERQQAAILRRNIERTEDFLAEEYGPAWAGAYSPIQ